MTRAPSSWAPRLLSEPQPQRQPSPGSWQPSPPSAWPAAVAHASAERVSPQPAQRARAFSSFFAFFTGSSSSSLAPAAPSACGGAHPLQRRSARAVAAGPRTTASLATSSAALSAIASHPPAPRLPATTGLQRRREARSCGVLGAESRDGCAPDAARKAYRTLPLLLLGEA